VLDSMVGDPCTAGASEPTLSGGRGSVGRDRRAGRRRSPGLLLVSRRGPGPLSAARPRPPPERAGRLAGKVRPGFHPRTLAGEQIGLVSNLLWFPACDLRDARSQPSSADGRLWRLPALQAEPRRPGARQGRHSRSRRSQAQRSSPRPATAVTSILEHGLMSRRRLFVLRIRGGRVATGSQRSGT